MDFPSTNLVAGTTTHTVGNNTWRWNGYAWTKDCCGATAGVTSFNGETGGVIGVSSVAGFTGDVATGVTTNEILYHDGSSINGSGDFTFDGTDVVLSGDGHFEGGQDGPLQKKIKADEALAALDPVYITGSVGASDRVTVAKADASDPAKMPAAGIVKTAFSTNQEGYMTIGGTIRHQDTGDYDPNDTLYVAAGGGVTAERPTGASNLIQNVARVGRAHANSGTVIITGANRTNDVPNLIVARAGLSCDSGGITFADGTFQSTAAAAGGGGPSPYTTITGLLDTVGSAGDIKLSDTTVQLHKQDDAGKDLRQYWSDAGHYGYLYIVDEDTPTDYVLFKYILEPTYDGTSYTFNGVTRSSVGIWGAGVADVYQRNCRIFYVPYGVKSFNGLTGDIDTTSLNLTVAGLSANNGATFAGEVNFLSGISCEKGITAENLSLHGPLTATTIDGTVITASSYFSGTLIGLATSASTATTATSATNATNVTIQAVSDDTDYRVIFAQHGGGGSQTLNAKADTGSGKDGLIYNPETDLLTLGGLSAGDGATFGAAINLSPSGVRFSDGTTQTTATVTGSYTGQIETVADKTYTLDPKVATARTVTGFYIKSASGTVTATLKNGSDTIKAASVSSSSGDQTSLANTSVSADAVLTIVTSSNSSALDMIFNVEYTTEI